MHTVKHRCAALIVTFACSITSAYSAQPSITQIESVVLKGKADTSICGFDVTKAVLKDVKSKLGKLKYKDKDELVKVYQWNKGALKVEIQISTDDDSIKHVTVKGDDPTGVCKTGRGLQLGQTLDDVKKIYGKLSSETIISDDGKGVSASLNWEQEADLYINMWFPQKTKRLSEIEVQYMLE